MSDSDPDRLQNQIDTLQFRIAFQDDLLDTLNRQIAQQEDALRQLGRTVEALQQAEQLAAGQGYGTDDVPPHY